uniref:SusC/RagA family TonB-linked outer membrane protein n=1 Tax=uncultured Bacteroides sp. TaxID=162156 RepID=UPI00262C134B|nr:SusC/RagA family TonB-linked outer membrane protein [uncultured Bacteroides sp.]
MVVAYGTAKKSSFTGSASVVSSDQIGKIQSSNVTNALSGKVSGVQLNNTTGQPGASSPTIRIRGISSINAGKDPLVILDGVPYDGDMNNLNGQDIESMTVLKDAASSALYGARGANGVIIITTKKGNAGQAKITVDAKWGSNSRATQNYNYVTDPAQYYEMWYGALKNYFVNAQGMNATNAHIMANNNLTTANSYGLGYNVYSVPAGQFMIGENGKLNPNARLGNVVSYNGQEYTLLPDDWTDAAYKNGLRQEYSLTATAGTDKSSFFASFNYLDNEGITENSDFTRITGRLKADYQLKDWIKIGANMGYAHFDANSLDADEDGNSSSSGNVFALTMMAPIYPLYMRDGNGKIMKDANGITRYDYGDGENAGLKRPYLGQSNALSSNILDVHNSEGNAINAVGFAEIRFLKDFKFTTTNSVMMDETRLSMVTNPYYGAYANSNGILYKYHTRQLAYNYQQLLNYKHSFGAHNVEAMLGHEAYTYKYYYLYANKTQMFDPTNSELAGAILDGSNSSYTTKYNTEGYFGRVQYDYNEKYFVSGSYRRDASSRFHPDNRWGNFWSLGGAWLISKESFFDVSWINELKIKASFGSQGNDAIGDFRYTDTYSIVNSNGKPAAVPNRRGNKDITWEINANFNAGVDFKLFKSRLNGTIEFFNRKTTDMLFSFPLPPTFGYTSYAANVGDMRNMGIEAELEGVILDTNDLKWTVNLNLTHYKNKVTYLPDERKTMTVDGVDGYSSGSYYYGENIPLYTFYMYKYAGVSEDGEALYYKDTKDKDGNVIGQETVTKTSDATMHLCGTALPDVYGGFSTSFSYKGIDFSADFAYQIGGQVYDGDYASSMSANKGHAFHADLLNAWSPENKSSNIPRFQYNDTYMASTSDRFLTSASYLSLQTLSLGYTLPTRICRSFGLEKLRVYATADNVWLWSKRQGLDPRQSISGSVSSAYYAPIRTISGGITLTF